MSGPGMRLPVNGENVQERRGVRGQGSKSCSGLLKSQEQGSEEVEDEARQVDKGKITNHLTCRTPEKVRVVECSREDSGHNP